jgi:hypothetical protein
MADIIQIGREPGYSETDERRLSRRQFILQAVVTLFAGYSCGQNEWTSVNRSVPQTGPTQYACRLSSGRITFCKRVETADGDGWASGGYVVWDVTHWLVNRQARR